MTTIKRTEISQLGEFGLIQHLTRDQKKTTDTLKSIGDDCAVIQNHGLKTLMATLFLRQNYFKLSWLLNFKTGPEFMGLGQVFGAKK